MIAGVVAAQPLLQPVDTSSPRATLESFFALADETGRRYNAFREHPSPATQAAFRQLLPRAVRLLDLSEVAPAARDKVATETIFMLWDVIGRLELPDTAEIPDQAAVADAANAGSRLNHWRIPGTEITIARVTEGARTGEFLFSPDTVTQAPSYYELTQSLPYVRPVPVENIYRINQTITGWMLPPLWIEALPQWASTLIAGQVLWKWFALLLLIGLTASGATATVRWAYRGTAESLHAIHARKLGAAIAVFALAELFWVLAARQINVTGAAANLPGLAREIVVGVATVWFAWTAAHWIAERIIASPRIPTNSLHANLIRFAARFVGFLTAGVLLFRAAQAIGIPVYGLIAGAGVGGLAIALAVRSTLENLVGTLNLYVDRPVRVGDVCRYGKDPAHTGMVEEIGLRSTRIRGYDRSVTTIPNAEFANMHIVNMALRDRILMDKTIGLRYETTLDQLKFVLAKLREMLRSHPQVANDLTRVRVTALGQSGIEVNIFAYVMTSERSVFLGVQEDLILRTMKVIADAGSALAFPSNTVYQTTDRGLDLERQRTAEQQAHQWESDSKLEPNAPTLLPAAQ